MISDHFARHILVGNSMLLLPMSSHPPARSKNSLISFELRVDATLHFYDISRVYEGHVILPLILSHIYCISKKHRRK